MIQLNDIYKEVKDKDEYSIKLLAGASGLSNPVSWVHMVEKEELTSFLEGNEIAFTTGIALNSIDELDNLVKLIYDNGASGMVINEGPYIPNIPNKIIGFCEQKQFPLFKVPWHVYMANIMKKISEMITLEERNSVEISSATLNAIFFHEQEKLYIPTFEKNGFHSTWSYCIAIISVEPKEDSVNSKMTIKEMENYIKNYLARKSYDVVVFEARGQLVFLFANKTYDEIYNVVNEVMKEYISYTKRKYSIYCGIGKNTNSIRCLHKSYCLADKVINLLKKRKAEYRIEAYNNLGIYKLLMGMDDHEIVTEYYNQTIYPLIEYDNKNCTDYMKFLQILFEEDGNIQSTANRLFLHRNTINYKIHKIEEILDCNMSSIDVKTELNLALKLIELM